MLEIFFSTIWKQKMTNEIKLQYWGHNNELTLISPFILSLDQTPKSEELRNAVALLRDGATRLREQCRTDTSEAQTEYRTKTQQVIQCAYDIAKAAKQLVTMFEWLGRNDDAPCYVWMIWYSAILEWIGRIDSPPLLNDSAVLKLHHFSCGNSISNICKKSRNILKSDLDMIRFIFSCNHVPNCI